MKKYIIIFIVPVFLYLCVMGMNIVKEDSRKQQHATYSAWVKYSGNQKSLTFKEWVSLKKSGLLPKLKRMP